MSELTLKIVDKNGNIRFQNKGQKHVNLVSTEEYLEGDSIILEASEKNLYIVLQLDDALGPAFVYVTDNISFSIPFGEKRKSYSPKVFSGDKHYLFAKIAKSFEVRAYRNLALNVADQHGVTHCYPHAEANVETRGESVFAARNAIDGVVENSSHGDWPYQSWGINRQDDAEMTIDFGRSVMANKVVLYTRADFPHDNWWRQVTLTFSDGTSIDWELEKSRLPHELLFGSRKITWIKLSNLIKADDPSPFPALSQIEVYGTVYMEDCI